MSNFLFLIVGLGIGLVVGFQHRAIFELQKKLQRPAKRVGVTNPYRMADQNKPYEPRPQGKTSGIVKPKSPARLQYEAEERLRKDSEKWGLTPRD